jgi:succinoglycan biosynthesis protein ExoA
MATESLKSIDGHRNNPVRNEQKAIRLSLSSVLAQDYPADGLEVLLADGMSDDGTRAIARRDPRVRLVDN